MAHNPLTTFRSGGGTFGGDPLLSLHREMNRLFDDFFRGPGLPTRNGGQNQGSLGNFIDASMDVSETDKEIRITAELPGVAEQDIDVSLDDDVLTIRGEKKLEQKNEKENYHFVERSYGTFQRSIRLPGSVDPEQVKADFENGVLTVTLPKSAQQERTHRIQVQGRSGHDGQQSTQESSAAGQNTEAGAGQGEGAPGGQYH